jgi:hypothetical protein
MKWFVSLILFASIWGCKSSQRQTATLNEQIQKGDFATKKQEEINRQILSVILD